MDIIASYGTVLVLIAAAVGFFYGLWYWRERRC
jgi:hypothetical protein